MKSKSKNKDTDNLSKEDFLDMEKLGRELALQSERTEKAAIQILAAKCTRTTSEGKLALVQDSIALAHLLIMELDK